MSMRSYIAKRVGEDQYLTIFCHYNGYPDDNGEILVKYYNTPDRLDQLLALGDLHSLGKRIAPDPNYPHNSTHPQKGVTIAYQRDEGMTNCGAVIMSLDELNDWLSDGVEYSFVYDQGNWLYFPIGEAEYGMRNLKEDLDADTVKFATPPIELEEFIDLLVDEDDFSEDDAEQKEDIRIMEI